MFKPSASTLYALAIADAITERRLFTALTNSQGAATIRAQYLRAAFFARRNRCPASMHNAAAMGRKRLRTEAAIETDREAFDVLAAWDQEAAALAA